MLIDEYASLAVRTDVARTRPAEQLDIALYGLAGEVGSLVSAVKKRLLAAGRQSWNVPNEEIEEELGDALWYCFALAAASGIGAGFLAADIRNLTVEITSDEVRSAKIRSVLGEKSWRTFVSDAPAFEADWLAGKASLDEYQRLAFLTSRTKDDQLVEVCLAVLEQLTAELMRAKLPELELELNKRLPDRSREAVLGEVAWHLAALASLYKLPLSKIAASNAGKLRRRFGRTEPTPLPDRASPESERLPRVFDIAFVPVGPGRSRMYMDGRRLGDDLTDNARTEDGYRFHDVMHLALAATLGWSPVLRKLMGRKRRSDPLTDEVEDGARAMIVEEAVINAIYAEGLRVAALSPPTSEGSVPAFFANGADISFTFLKRISGLVYGLEAARNAWWEWEDAIVRGFDIFARLRNDGQGTVSIDVERRTLAFTPSVLLDAPGRIAGIGMAATGVDEAADAVETRRAQLSVRRSAMLNALGIHEAEEGELVLTGWRGDLIGHQASGAVRRRMWDLGVVTFRAAALNGDFGTTVTALAIADD